MRKINTLKPTIAKLDTRQGASVATERIRGGRLKTIRGRIALRDGYECQMCGRATAQGEVDHIIPLHLGGRETDENRQLLCVLCHKTKSEREEAQRNG